MPISYDSPKRTLDTFRHAIRFQDAKVLYECMSEEFKDEQGFDALSFTVFWEKLLEQQPALPALGDSRIVAARWLSPSEKAFTLEAYGRQVRVSFSSRPSFEYGELQVEAGAWPPPEGEGAESEEPADELDLTSTYLRSLEKVRLNVDGDVGRISLNFFDPDLLVGFEPKAFALLRVGRTWKLRSISLPDPEK